jgi:hypothetical protein
MAFFSLYSFLIRILDKYFAEIIRSSLELLLHLEVMRLDDR